MRLEQVFFIYRRLAKKSIDLCEKIEVTRDYGVDLEMNPLAIKVKFIPRHKRNLTKEEERELKPFCDYHGLEYEFNERGDMIWRCQSAINRGKQRTGQM